MLFVTPYTILAKQVGVKNGEWVAVPPPKTEYTPLAPHVLRQRCRMNMNEFALCPFCGCRPHYYVNRQVECMCGAKGPVEDGPKSAKWNTQLTDAHKLRGDQ